MAQWVKSLAKPNSLSLIPDPVLWEMSDSSQVLLGKSQPFGLRVCETGQESSVEDWKLSLSLQKRNIILIQKICLYFFYTFIFKKKRLESLLGKVCFFFLSPFGFGFGFYPPLGLVRVSLHIPVTLYK